MFWRCSIVRNDFRKVDIYEESVFLEKVFFSSIALPTLRVGRSVTRLTVYWAFPYHWGSRKRESKRAANLDKKINFEVNNIRK